MKQQLRTVAKAAAFAVIVIGTMGAGLTVTTYSMSLANHFFEASFADHVHRLVEIVASLL